MADSHSLDRLIDRARRRATVNLVWSQAMVGLTASLAGAILLLLLGTQILDWYWLVVLFGGGMGLGIWRTLRRLPTPYQVAQRVDQRLGLRDSLSTAFHFERTPTVRADAAVVAAQRSEALQVASTVQPADAWPLTMPRQIYPAAACLAVVIALGVVRFGMQGSLDLSAPMLTSVADFFWSNQKVQAKNQKRPFQLNEDDLFGVAMDRADTDNPEQGTINEDALKFSEVPETSNEGVTSYKAKADKNTMKATAEEGDDSGSGEKDGSSGENIRDAKGAKNEPGGDPSGKQSPTQGKAPQSEGSENSSLLDKMKDAMANLMSKLSLPSQSSESQKANSQSKQGGEKRESASQKGQKGSQEQSNEKGTPGEGEPGDQQAGEQEAQAGENAANQGAESAKNEGQSGVGKQDGAKDLRDAEQMKAMGKLSEIFGKRAQNITGEIMLEVSSGKQQQLRTAYSNRNATHREAGGEIHRDEVPLAYQHYVQQYFEKVRSQKPAESKSQH